MRWLRAGSCEVCGLLGNLWDKRQPCRHWINRAYTLILNKALDTKLYQASLGGETMWSLLGIRGGNTGHSSMRKGWLESLFRDLPFCPSHLFLWYNNQFVSMESFWQITGSEGGFMKCLRPCWYQKWWWQHTDDPLIYAHIIWWQSDCRTPKTREILKEAKSRDIWWERERERYQSSPKNPECSRTEENLDQGNGSGP